MSTPEEVATQRTNAVIDPQLAAIQRAQEEADRKAAAAWARQQEAIRGYSEAAARMLQGTGQQVQQGYADAGQRTQNYAKGFSIGFNQAVSGNADAANALLAQQGSPQHVASQGTAGADVIYGTGGFIPASSLEREGAAFGAAASMLPSTQLGYGSQRLQQGQAAYDADLAARNAEYGNLRKDVLGTRGKLMQDYLQQIRENNLARQKFAEDKRAALAGEAINRRSVETSASYLKTQQRQQALAEATARTNAEGLLYFVNKKGEVELARDKKGRPIQAKGSDAFGQVTDRSNAANSNPNSPKNLAAKRREKREKAITARNDATVAAKGAATTYVEQQLAPGVTEQVVGEKPMPAYDVKTKTGTVTYDVRSDEYFANSGKKYTTSVANAKTQPIYEKTAIPKADYQRLRATVITRLSQQLGRYGYKRWKIEEMANEILDNYYTVSERTTSTR